MSYTTIISATIGLAIPVLVAFFVSRLVLKRLAKRLATTQHRSVKSTVFDALRLPAVVLGWLIGIQIATLIIRTDTPPFLSALDWNAVDVWIKSAATLDVFFIVYRVLMYGVRVATTNADAGSAILVRKILAAVFAGLAAITVLEQFSIDIGPVLASLGVAGLAVALALQDTLSNYFAGIIVAVDKPFRPGDYIIMEDGLEGFVQTIGWRTTRIQPFGETIVVVPNSKLANSVLTNTFYPGTDVRVYIECGVSYESDLEHVEQVTLDVARQIQKTADSADPEFEPIVLFHTFADSNINFKIILRSFTFTTSGGLRSTFMKALHKRFNEEGIEINYPVRKVVGLEPTSTHPG